MKMLIVLSRIPFPLDKGDKLRAYHQIKELIAMRYEITICCVHYGTAENDSVEHLKQMGGEWHFIQLSPWRAALRLGLNFFKRTPFQVALFHSYKAQQKINAIISQTKPNHLIAQLVRTSEYIKNQIHIKKSVDYMDAFGFGLQSRALHSPFWLNLLLKEESQRMFRYENIIWHYFDHHFIISHKDASQIRIPKLQSFYLLPNGIDTSYFKRTNPRLGEKIVFTGNMAYPPNIDAALFLIHEIMPLVWESYPEIILSIAGTHPDTAILKEQNARIEVTGRVNDIRNCYEQAAIFVAPMRLGTGMQNKILEALSMEIPVITTALAADAFKYDIQRALMIASDARQIAQLIKDNLHTQIEPKKHLRELVVKEYNWKNIMETFSQTINEN